MREVKEKICYWYERARDNFYGPRAKRSSYYEDCMRCNGKDRECGKYFEITKTWMMQENSMPHEDSHHARRKKE